MAPGMKNSLTVSRFRNKVKTHDIINEHILTCNQIINVYRYGNLSAYPIHNSAFKNKKTEINEVRNMKSTK